MTDLQGQPFRFNSQVSQIARLLHGAFLCTPTLLDVSNNSIPLLCPIIP